MQGHKPSQSEIQRIIEDGNAVKSFRTSRVAKLLEDWIEQQRKGQVEYMQVEIGSLNGLNLFKWFGAFLKYTYLVQENRAYRKMEAFLDSIERNGEKYEEQRRRAAAKSTDKQD
jgi:hypothetical protein